VGDNHAVLFEAFTRAAFSVTRRALRQVSVSRLLFALRGALGCRRESALCDAGLGCVWTSKDPARFGGDEGNLYAYCHNDPVNFVDPNGHNAALAAGPILGFIFFALLASYLLALQYSKGKPVKPPQIVRPVMQRLEWLIIYGLSKYLGNDNGDPQPQPQAGSDGGDCPPYDNFMARRELQKEPPKHGSGPVENRSTALEEVPGRLLEKRMG
jgi:hypothetical protein